MWVPSLRPSRGINIGALRWRQKFGGANLTPKSRNEVQSVLWEVWGGRKRLFILENVEEGGGMLYLSQ